jgi:quercetin dioxygenase-like cupin family protein
MSDSKAEVRHGLGHNIDSHAPGEAPVWEQWTKKRVFVRALEGTYGELVGDLFTQPRVYSSKAKKWKGGPATYGKFVISPMATKIVQTIETHIECFAPGGCGQKHGHMNSAVFYVLKGKGHDVHDGRSIPWEAGDALIVENGCVHQHFNDDPDEEAIVVVMKAKPLFLFMHMLFQQVVEYPPKVGTEKQMAYVPPADL